MSDNYAREEPAPSEKPAAMFPYALVTHDHLPTKGLIGFINSLRAVSHHIDNRRLGHHTHE